MAFNIWSVLLSSYIWGRNECHQTRQATDKGTSRPAEIFWGPVEWLWERGASNIWMHSRKVNKYLYFSNLNFTMKGASVKKVILRFSSGNDPICHSQKFQPSQTPPSHFLPISPRFLTNIRCQYFSLNIWVVYDQLELDWCIFDQNWAKTRPLHFQIFQIPNAIDRPIVHWWRLNKFSVSWTLTKGVFWNNWHLSLVLESLLVYIFAKLL